MFVRAIRGAVTVEHNDACEILDSTQRMLKEIFQRNEVAKENLISMIFSVTRDLDAAFPAVAARQLGITDVALMCTYEIEVPGSLEKCIRVMIHFNTDKENGDIKHVYLDRARSLRPDLTD
jgi:chorismate mutase